MTDVSLSGICSDENEMSCTSLACPLTRQEGNSNYYSQTYEDYILSLILPDINNGTYIDVGASSPDHFSVTKHFYLRGWSGINFEPLEHHYNQFTLQRPRDINLKLGAYNKEITLDLHVTNADTLSTLNTDDLAAIQKYGFKVTKKIPIELKTLNQVLIEHPIKDIDFITIDVEGSEKEVLEGLDLDKHRPKIFIIESVEPYTHKPTHTAWETLLTRHDYEFILSDWLNRYYVLNEYKLKSLDKFARVKRCVESSKHYKEKAFFNY